MRFKCEHQYICLTSANETGRVLQAVKVDCHYAAEVSDTNVHSHPDSTFVLTGEVIAQPAKPLSMGG